MKKHFFIALFLCLICLLTASCSKNDTSEGDSENINTELHGPTETVDVDLTILSSTMVYAEVYNIMLNPEEYVGKTIKMSGPYYTSYYDKTDQYYHYVIIRDAAACCQSGLEFVWNGEHTYPNDYPDEQTEIEVIGIFGSYEELGETYYYLAVDDIAVLKEKD